MRQYEMKRETKETEIYISLNLDGSGIADVETPCKFLNHMLELLGFHSGIDLTIRGVSLDNIQHHLVEDIAITLGAVIKNALGVKQGINRYGSSTLPMDEVLVTVAIDLSGRHYFKSNLEIRREYIEDLSGEMIDHFFKSLTDNLAANLHILIHYGDNEHHKVEGAFKALARALKEACMLQKTSVDKIASTKGVL